MAYTEILAGFAILYATDSILVVVDGVGREIVASGIACAASNSSFTGTLLPIQFRQTHLV